jgi:hypothetical protein
MQIKINALEKENNMLISFIKLLIFYCITLNLSICLLYRGSIEI